MTKVLVVDDSLSVRKVVERALAGRQIQVVLAASGSEAIERIERDRPDVVVCDVVMPDLDGYKICDFVKSHPQLGTTPVLLISGVVTDAVRERAAEVRSDGVMSKPFAADELVSRIDGLLALPTEAPGAAPSQPPPSTLAPPVVQRPVPAAMERVSSPVVESAVPIALERVSSPVVESPAPVALERVSSPVVQSYVPISVERISLPVEPEPSLVELPAPERRPAAVSGVDLKSILAQFSAMDGVGWAALVDREGFLIETTAESVVVAEVAGALSACLAEASDGLGRELRRGALAGMILEYEKGVVVLMSVGGAAMLAITVVEPAVLGKVRYYAKRALVELQRAF